MDCIQSDAPPTDMWIKANPRHQVVHLLPAGWTETACGIPYTVGTYLPIGKTKECPQCRKFLQETEQS